MYFHHYTASMKLANRKLRICSKVRKSYETTLLSQVPAHPIHYKFKLIYYLSCLN